jgi:hypothetical protein
MTPGGKSGSNPTTMMRSRTTAPIVVAAASAAPFRKGASMVVRRGHDVDPARVIFHHPAKIPKGARVDVLSADDGVGRSSMREIIGKSLTRGPADGRFLRRRAWHASSDRHQFLTLSKKVPVKDRAKIFPSDQREQCGGTLTSPALRFEILRREPC